MIRQSRYEADDGFRRALGDFGQIGVEICFRIGSPVEAASHPDYVTGVDSPGDRGRTHADLAKLKRTGELVLLKISKEPFLLGGGG
ncbi:hypothetical protein GCM10011503_07890 [Henriciella pelagia]|uniref:Uncharacterized protein n=1 Tax=Henriciella pelagia TaxID=1977912 RepID=A0ABQ1JAJ3_9PROT|nr:hypothetical protein GCM10011503_07890 [Henriciella pelagia]